MSTSCRDSGSPAGRHDFITTGQSARPAQLRHRGAEQPHLPSPRNGSCVSGLRGKPWIFWGERLRPGNPAGGSGCANISSARRCAAPRGSWAWAAAPMEDYREAVPGPAPFFHSVSLRSAAFFASHAPRHNPGEIVFLFCGQMIERKGVDLLIAAFAQIAAENANVRLLLVGREAELPAIFGNASAKCANASPTSDFNRRRNSRAFLRKRMSFYFPAATKAGAWW